MHKPALTVVVVALIAAIAGILIVPQLLADNDAPTVRWSAGDEIELAADAAPETGTDQPSLDRTAVELVNAANPAIDDRVELLLQGRVIDKFKAPIAGASVWLDFGRGGGPRGGQNNRQRRVPDPVQTDGDGRFAFQGQAFRNLRISLQVAHPKFAPGLFDKDIGAVTTSVDLGDLALVNGGQIRGRVTDLDGNAIPEAELHLQPQNGNSLRFLRDRERLLPAITTDRNGSYLVAHATAGDWSLTATAARHQDGRSATFAVEEDQAVDVPDIRLGPGFEVTGYVRDVQGQPIAKANVSMRSEERNRANGGQDNGQSGPGGPGGRGFAFGFGRDFTTTTDEKGSFFLDHLPGALMSLTTDAEGYLEYSAKGIDPKVGQPLQITLQDGLKMTAEVKDLDGTPVTLFAFRAVHLRALPLPGMEQLDPQTIFQRLRDGNLDEATTAQLQQQADSLRSQFGGRGGRGQPGQGRQGPTDLGRPEKHPGGTLVAAGLQEGVYELHVQSPDHARYSSAEIEVRAGAPAPVLQIALDGGVFVAGVVVDEKQNPVRNAHVELRAPSAFGGRGRRQNGGQNARGAAAAPADATAQAQGIADMARQFMRQAAGAQITVEATTDAEGIFVIKHASRGSYVLGADARGYANASSETFDLQTDRSGFELKLGLLGSIEGLVRGVTGKDLAETRVAAVPAAGAGGGPGQWFGGGRGGGNGGGRGGPFQTANVNADGSYRLADLVPGDYIVRSWVGSPQDLMRELMPQFMAGSLAPDASVRGGEVTHLDLQLTRPQLGTVAGSVVLNGVPASGVQVDLTRQDDNAAANPGANMGRGGGPGGRGRGFGGSLQGTVATSGHFSIEKVPAGEYRLRLQSARRGDTIYEEVLQVAADTTTERNLALTTFNLKGSVTADDGGKVEDLDGRVSLLQGVASMPDNLNEVQRQVPSFDTRLQNGQFEFGTVQPGNYLLVLSVRGRERTSQAIVINGDQSLALIAGKVSTTPPANAPAAPGAAPGSAQPGGGRQRGGQGAGRQGGGRQGGGRQGGTGNGQPNVGTPPGGG